MKPLMIASLASALMVTNLPAAYAQSGGDEQVLLQLERDWERANVQNDTAALERIFAPEFVSTDSDGRLTTRAEGLARRKSGAVKFSSFVQDDFRVHVIGDTAVVTGRITMTAVRDGKDVSGQERFTDVFVRRGGRWQALATHSSRVRAR